MLLKITLSFNVFFLVMCFVYQLIEMCWLCDAARCNRLERDGICIDVSRTETSMLNMKCYFVI